MLSVFAAIVLALALAQPPGGAPTEVRIGEINGPAYRLVGRLGRPFGEVVTVQGVVVEGPAKGNESGWNVIIQRVGDGSPVREFVRLPVRPGAGAWGEAQGGELPPMLEAGATYELRGYETGGFVGVPDDPAGGGEPVASQTEGGHRFVSRFEVFAAKRISPVEGADVQHLIGYEVLIEGPARNNHGRPRIDVGAASVVVAGGQPWPARAMGKSVTAFGRIRKTDEKTFWMEQGPNAWRSLTNLEDQLDQLTSLRGVVHSGDKGLRFEYRGTPVQLEPDPDGGAAFPAGWSAATAEGRLVALDPPVTAEDGTRYAYRLTKARVRPLVR